MFGKTPQLGKSEDWTGEEGGKEEKGTRKLNWNGERINRRTGWEVRKNEPENIMGRKEEWPGGWEG